MSTLTLYLLGYIKQNTRKLNTLKLLLQDGRFATTELCHLVMSHDGFTKAKENITSTQVLVIDEISMVVFYVFIPQTMQN